MSVMQFQIPLQLSNDSFQADSVIEDNTAALSIDNCLKLADTTLWDYLLI